MFGLFAPKDLPKDITTYDLLKMVAVLLMIVDHIGWYFFPDDNMWRVVGRWCVPLWFFLIGYAQSRSLGRELWIGGGVLLIANVIVGIHLLPVNILFSMLIARMALDRVVGMTFRSRRDMGMSLFVLSVIIIPTAFLWEYGTLGIILALFGYAMRHREEVQKLHKDMPEFFMLSALLIFVLFQTILFVFNQQEMLLLSLGTFFAFTACYLFKPATFPRLTKTLPGFLVGFVHVMGRRTLEIYVIHLLAFKFMGMAVNPERFSLFQFTLFLS